MSTFNGIGTKYYDWFHKEDGTSHATKWFVIAFLPVIPLGRQHLKVLTSGEKPPFFSMGKGSFHMEYVILGTVPQSIKGVIKTYLKAYLLLPIVLLVPTFILMLFYKWTFPRVVHVDQMSVLHKTAMIATIGSIIIYWGIVTSRILDRSSGRIN